MDETLRIRTQVLNWARKMEEGSRDIYKTREEQHDCRMRAIAYYEAVDIIDKERLATLEQKATVEKFIEQFPKVLHHEVKAALG